MLYGIVGILVIIIIYLSIKLNKKTILDNSEINKYKYTIDTLKEQESRLQNDLEIKSATIQEFNNKILEVQNKYREELNKKSDDLNQYFENQKLLRQSEMDTDFERQERERKESLNLRIRQMINQAEERANQAEIDAHDKIERLKKAMDDIAAETSLVEERYEALLAPLRQYEMEQQERLFYTIQVPDEYKDDINFLVTTVSQKVQHPDVINKLVWTEYVKPYIDQTFKRIQIKDEPGIYKLTDLNSGKCYIGKSTNVKKRVADHFKSSVGIKTIADQAVHHEIWKTGFWNWTIEVIIYCEKEQLNELEKYYIDFFKSQEFGYNKIL